MSEDSSFLSRWSRRKIEARKEERAPAPQDDVQERTGQDTAEPDLPAEELALLPRIEDLTSTTDLTPFLRKGVPAALRNAALRRAWSLDPEIRDYVSEAREYAYDWNVPGSVPGMEPLRSFDDVETMVNAVLRPFDTQAEDRTREALKASDIAAHEAEPPGGEGAPEAAAHSRNTAVQTAPASLPNTVSRHGGAAPNLPEES